MAEYIEREAALDAISGWLMKALHTENMSSYNEGERDAYRTALSEIANLPAADVQPVVKGFNKLKDYPTLFECSVCGWECDDTMPGDTATYNFCPNCGAEMEES